MSASGVSNLLNFYAKPGKITQLGKHRKSVSEMTNDIRAIFQIVQGLIVHDMWIKRYGLKVNPGQMWAGIFIDMEELLDQILKIDPMLLTIPRSPGSLAVACCREFAAYLRF